jgi:DNA-binding CsgD family transcriptional regulator
MQNALPLLARAGRIEELLPCVLQVIRDYAPVGHRPRYDLARLVVRVLSAAGEQEAAGVCLEQMIGPQAEGNAQDSWPEAALLSVMVAEEIKPEEALDTLAGCVAEAVADRSLCRLTESATLYFAHLMLARQYERIESECRPPLFEATRDGDDFVSGLLLWRSAAASARGAGSARLHAERALGKLRPLGAEALLSAVGMVVDQAHPADHRNVESDLAALVGALEQTDWAWASAAEMHPPALAELADRIVKRSDPVTFERWAAAGQGLDLAELLCRILPAHWVRPPGGSPLGPVPGPAPNQSVDPARLREYSPLTPRESEVASLVAVGLTNKQIGKRLRISEWTVINHLRQVMRKLGCRSRVQVANWVRDIAPDSRAPHLAVARCRVQSC